MLIFMKQHNQGYNICVAHNGSGYDAQLVSEVAGKMGLKKKCIPNGLKLTQLQIGNVYFRDSMLFLTGGLAGLAKNFELPIAKGYFPHLFNSKENYGYKGNLPEEKFFDLTFTAKTDDDIKAFKDWYNERKKQPWDFEYELEYYCALDVDILARIMKSFHDVCVSEFGSSPWFYPTNPSYCHRIILRENTRRMNLPEDPEERASTIHQLAKENWARLVPQEYWFARKALIGGRTDVKQIHYRLTEQDIAAGRKIMYQDIVSMYPYVQVANKYPVGIPTIHVFDDMWYPCKKHQYGDSQNNWSRCDCRVEHRFIDPLVNVNTTEIRFTEQKLIDMADEMFGIWCVSLSPPKNLYHPVLCVYNSRTKKRVATLEDIHEGVFTSVEVVKALKVGYKLIQVHRMDVYKAREALWSDFVKKLYIKKMMNSEPAPDLDEQNKLVKAYEKRFRMGRAVRESFAEWEKRPALRMTFKIMLNSGWGKHCTRPNTSSLTFVNPDDEEEMAAIFEGLASQEINVTSMIHQGGSIAIRSNSKNADFVPHDLYLPAGLFVPAYGRLMLYEALETIGDRVLYHDTDSVIYIYDPAKRNLEIDDVWGSWSEESVSLGNNIEAFVGLGAKSYAIKTKNGKDIVKLKGISLKRAHQKQVNFRNLEELMVQRGKMMVPQMGMPYRIGLGKSIEEFEKIVQFDPKDLKGYLHTDNRVYPPGYCMGCLGLGDHVC